MSIVIGAGGSFEVGPPPEDDPTRQAHARLIRLLAHELEISLQAHECFDSDIQKLQQRMRELESVVSVLEDLVMGAAA